MNRVVLLAAFLVAAIAAGAQSYSTKVSYNKTHHHGLVLQLPYSEEVSEDFIVANLKKTGYDPETKGKFFWKQNKINDFHIFKGVMLPGAAVPVDLYFKVDRHSKKLKDQSTIHLLVSRGDEQFIGPGEDTAFIVAQNFLNSLVPHAATYKLNLDIDNQEKTVRDAEKKLGKLQEDEQDINEKIADLQKDLAANRNSQETQRKQIETERLKLAELKGRSTGHPAQTPPPPVQQ